MKPYLFPAILAAVLASGLRFLATGSAVAFAVTIVLVIVGVVMFIEYEIELANRELDMRIEEWNIQQKCEAEIMMTKTAIRRELIRTWEEIA